MRASTPLEEKVLALIEPAAADLGYRLVRVRVSGMRRKRLQIMAERAADGQMLIEDCEALSKAVSPVLDAADPISGEYDLEVSSPGIDRPLVSPEDFARFAGHEAKLELARPTPEGRKRFRGVIAGLEGGAVVLSMPDAEGPVHLPFEALSEARLVLTDALIEESLKRGGLRAQQLDDVTDTDFNEDQDP